MDVVLKTGNGRFNFRVCAIITNSGKLLAMRDENAPYYYLPGGRVHLHETAEAAVLRELNEELGISAFFVEEVSNDRFHEICFYYLIDASNTDLINHGDNFSRTEGKNTLRFEWLRFEDLETKYIYPEFIKKEIFNLPERIIVNVEDRLK